MIYIVTAVHNRYKITKKFVKMLKSQTKKQFMLLLIDDGSTDGTIAMVQKNLPDTVILYGNGNLWWGGALHKAYQWLILNAEKDDMVIFSNDDVFWPNNYLEIGCAILSTQNEILLTGLGYSKQTGKLVDAPVVWDFPHNKGHCPEANELPNCCSTRSLFFRVGDFAKIGGFHPIMLPHYLSDYEWTIRAVRKGYKIVTDERLCYWLDESSTGLRNRKQQSIKQIFSKKSNVNPLVRINFIILSTPMKYKMQAFISQISRLLDR